MGDTRNPTFPFTSDWDSCRAHQWEERDSQFSSELYADVTCKLCGAPGEMTRETGDVYWPTT